ncbi:hypothetical protein OIU77_031137 [Salix suchowensis]|uniref:RWP-RK domain-containing protein n=1 Tax=Salix suchowensis TaxID=1278906 RepID=A0ABQ9BEE0_9ROSI|nr:hypothetical protein OIU77_031137 [Salix suchowensis]
MADPRSVVPYNDPYESPIDYENLNFMNDANPSLAGLSSGNGPTSAIPESFSGNEPTSAIPESFSGNEPTSAIPESFSGNANANANANASILDPNDPYQDPMVWNFYYENLRVQSHEDGPSHQNQGQSSVGQIPNASFLDASFPDASFFDASFPNAPIPDGTNFKCIRKNCCQVLREIIHTDGNYTTKLEIHGRMGIICHAILENRDHVKAIHPEHYMFDFCKKSLENVKDFLQKYCDERRQAGFIMVQDPHTFFYEALCVGYEWMEDLQYDDFYDPSPSNSGEPQATNQAEGEIETERPTRSNLALQRERAGKLTLNDFREYFHLPIEDAARKLELCPTVVKKICRKHGMTRWPHRKIKSILRQLKDLKVLSNSIDAEERARAQAETMRLQEEMRKACSGSAGL